ncbi:MAG: tyrosine-type recombinase/integrase [bacterium]|nr:tyrosine-type recombinase/integrase [bacterium]
MGRRKGSEGSVRRTPGGSGQWQARLPSRLDVYRRPLPGTFASESAAWTGLRAAIVDMDRNAGFRPRGRPNSKVRRVSDVLSDYIAARKYSALAPIAIRTVRDYRSVLANHVCRKRADIGRVPVYKLTGRDIRQWMDDLAADGVGVGTISNARRVLGAALAWEVREGRLGVNPATHVRIESSKARRAAMQTVDPVLLPSWGQFARLVDAPEDEHDRLFLALLGWCGLRWSEGVSLHEQAVWRDRPQITIDRVLVRRTQNEVDADTGIGLHLLENNYWRQEPPKAGVTATVPLPRPLWRRLVILADQRLRDEPLPMPAGRLLFRRPIISPGHTRSVGVLDNTNFRRDVWLPARQAAGLVGDASLPALDPRRYPMKVKDLRAFAASVLLDSGSSLTEAALLLRHSDKKTTERHYARAMQERAHDRARRDVQIDKGASLPERLDALWDAWVQGFPEVIPRLGMEWGNVREIDPRRQVT